MQVRIEANGERGRRCNEGLQGMVDASWSIRNNHQPHCSLL
jgi:hypothetical protein